MEDGALTRRKRQLALARQKSIARRQRRSKLRFACKSGEVDPIALLRGELEEWEDDIAGWRLEQLVMIVPGIGSATAQEVYEVGKFSPRQLVSSLSSARRAELARLCHQGQRL
jgi:hypothetical protein